MQPERAGNGDSEIPPAFAQSVVDYARLRGPDLLKRTEALSEWWDARIRERALPYFRSLEGPPSPVAQITDVDGRSVTGINFASMDYLNLATHPSVHEAAVRAIRDFGVHSAGSGALAGNTRASLELETALAEHLQTEHVALFPTGWAAGFAAIQGLVRPQDYVVMDSLTHSCLQQGAHAATQRVVLNVHLNADSVVSELRRIRNEDPSAGILVVTEGLFSMDADTPRIADLQEACREHGATLLVDVAHDLGALGPQGTGRIGEQGMLGKVDIVMGSLSKTLAANGGFVATHSPTAKLYVKLYGSAWMFSTALSPVQAAAAREALRIVRSDEGDALRASLMRVALALRGACSNHGIECLGDPGPIVPVRIGSEAAARYASGLIAERGLLTNLAEFPAVPARSARFRMQLMANHTEEQAVEAARIAAGAIAEARERFPNVRRRARAAR